jgi:Zn-dependent protease/predicted transcriptional regulator
MRSMSIFGGQFFGVEFRIHMSFLFLLAYLLLSVSGHGWTSGSLTRAFALTGLVLLSVFMHELGRVAAALRSGTPIRGNVLFPLGGIALPDLNHETEPAARLGQEIRLAGSGLAVSAFLAAASGLILLSASGFNAAGASNLWSQPWMDVSALGKSFFWINTLLFAVNLLPAYPLDGGRILRGLMARTMEYRQATRRAVTIGHLLAALVFLGGLYTPWLMLVGVFLFMATQMEERTVMFHAVAESVQIEDIMLTHFSTLSPADTLQDALSKAVHSLQDDFPVVSGSDLVGVINRQTIVEHLRREGNGYVQGAMNKAFEIASRTEPLSSAFRKLTLRGLTLIPVVDQERLVGIVTLQNLTHSIGLFQVSRQLRKKMEDQL